MLWCVLVWEGIRPSDFHFIDVLRYGTFTILGYWEYNYIPAYRYRSTSFPTNDIVWGGITRAPVDVLRESGEGNTSVVIVEHVHVRVQYERVARACILRQNYKIHQIFLNLAVSIHGIIFADFGPFFGFCAILSNI